MLIISGIIFVIYIASLIFLLKVYVPPHLREIQGSPTRHGIHIKSVGQLGFKLTYYNAEQMTDQLIRFWVKKMGWSECDIRTAIIGTQIEIEDVARSSLVQVYRNSPNLQVCLNG